MPTVGAGPAQPADPQAAGCPALPGTDRSLRLQELATDDKTETGRIPRTIEVEMAAHLVDTCLPGDVISLAGIVKVVTTEEGGSSRPPSPRVRAPARRCRPRVSSPPWVCSVVAHATRCRAQQAEQDPVRSVHRRQLGHEPVRPFAARSRGGWAAPCL